MAKRKKEGIRNNSITEEEYFTIKNASLREVGLFNKYKNELRYYKKHLTNTFKSYSPMEHILASLCFFAYAAIFYFTIRAVYYAIPNDRGWKAAAILGVFAGFFIGIIIMDKLHREIVVLRVRKDCNAKCEAGIVVVSCMKSQHVFGRSGHSQNVFCTTYRVVINVDGLRSVTYTKNRYYEKGEQVAVLINKKRHRFCYIPVDLS